MTDDPTTDAELISAYLDGEATPAEVARVLDDPSLVAAAADLQALREQLTVDDPPAGLVDDHVAAALAAFDDEHGAGEPDEDEPAADRVTDLSTRRRPLLQRLPLGAIAAAVVLIALFGALAQIDSGGEDTATDEAALDTGDGGDDAAEEATDGEGETFSADAPDEAAGLEAAPSRQAFTDTDDLAQHLATRLDGFDSEEQPADEDVSASSTATQQRTADSCDAVTAAGVAPPAVTLVFPAVVAGSPVTAVVTESDDGERRLVVVDDGSCTVIDDRPL